MISERELSTLNDYLVNNGMYDLKVKDVELYFYDKRKDKQVFYPGYEVSNGIREFNIIFATSTGYPVPSEVYDIIYGKIDRDHLVIFTDMKEFPDISLVYENI